MKVGKKTPLTLVHFEECLQLLPERADGERSWTVTRKDIEAKGYDLKAVNPNARSQEDRRTPDELLDLIEAKGHEVAEVVAALRALRRGWSVVATRGHSSPSSHQARGVGSAACGGPGTGGMTCCHPAARESASHHRDLLEDRHEAPAQLGQRVLDGGR